MKVRYKKKKMRFNLIYGIIWAVFGLLSLNYGEENEWTDYVFILMAVLYLGQYFYEWRNQYLTIDSEFIKVNSSFGKKIRLSEISWIKKFAGDYILKTATKELTINTQIIDKVSLNELNEILAKLELPSDKTPFANNSYNSSHSRRKDLPASGGNHS